MTLTLPTRIGRYELLVSLGSGGMATVYLARHTGPAGYQRQIALKLLHPHMRNDPQAVLDFIQEARLASELRHPNIVQVLDVDDQPEGLFMVMEHIEGGSLAALLRGNSRVPLPISMRLLTDALAGLHHAHQHRDAAGRSLQVVHRDFTPQNILAGVDGVVKLTDFGIAKVLGASQRTTTGVVKGKVRYMSPEQAEGRLVDARTDIWAAGVVAWELVTRRRLYAGDNEVAILLEIVRGHPARAKSVRPEISTDLDEAIARALEPDPNRRYASADAFRQALLAAAPEIADIGETSAFVRQAFEDSLKSRRLTLSTSMARSAPAVAIPARENESVTITAHNRRSRVRVMLALTGSMALVSAAAAVFASSRAGPRDLPTPGTTGLAPASTMVARDAGDDNVELESDVPETPGLTSSPPSSATASHVESKSPHEPRIAAPGGSSPPVGPQRSKGWRKRQPPPPPPPPTPSASTQLPKLLKSPWEQ